MLFINRKMPKLFDLKKIYLENKHLPSKHSNSVKVAFTDIGSIVVWPVSGPGSVRLSRRWLRWSGFWAAGGHCRQCVCGAAIMLTCRKQMDLLFTNTDKTDLLMSIDSYKHSSLSHYIAQFLIKIKTINYIKYIKLSFKFCFKYYSNYYLAKS